MIFVTGKPSLSENGQFSHRVDNNGISAVTFVADPLPDAVNQLFATFQPASGMATPETETFPWESRLYGLILKGTAGSAMAVVQDLDGGPEQIVRTGDSIGDALITAIDRNYLELDGPWGRDILRLPAGDRHTVPVRDMSRQTGASKRAAGSLQVIDRQELRNLVTRLDALSNEITLQPVRSADGEPAGFRVASLKPQGLLAQMGVRRGDTLVAINSQQIRTTEDAYRILESTFHQNTLTLSIIRNQQTMEFSYVIR